MHLILELIRNLQGYVSFKVTGGCPEKFLNLSVKNKFNLWNVRKINGDLLASSKIRDYKKLRYNARKSNSKLKIINKIGLPFFIHKYRNRKGIIAGLLLFVAVMCIMPLYVWKVDVKGCNNLNNEEVESVMRDIGISSGSLKSSINIPMAKQQAMQKLDSVAWMSINLNGSRAEILIKEKTLPPEQIVPENEPSNVIAEFDGQIERMETYSGTPVVSSGNVVVKGQLLISGISEKSDGGNEFLCADGKVYARTHRILSERVKTNFESSSDSGICLNKYRLKVFNLEIPLNFKNFRNKNCYGENDCEKNYRFETTDKKFKIFGAYLPIVIYKESAYEQNVENINLSEAESKNIAMQMIEKKELQEFGNEVQIKSREWGTGKMMIETGEYYQECHYDLVENIAKKEKIIVDTLNN